VVKEKDVSKILGNIIIYDTAEAKGNGDAKIDEGKVVKVVLGKDESVIASPTVQFPLSQFKNDITTISAGDNSIQSGFHRMGAVNLSGTVKIASRMGECKDSPKGGPLYIYADSLTLGDATLTFDTKGDPVYFFVKGDIEIRKSRVNADRDPRDLLLYSLGSSASPASNSQDEWVSFSPTVKITENSTARFLLLAPSSDVQISSSQLLGSFIGGRILISESSEVTFPKDTLGKLKDVAIIMSWEEK
jgi:hypothetical protein